MCNGGRADQNGASDVAVSIVDDYWGGAVDFRLLGRSGLHRSRDEPPADLRIDATGATEPTIGRPANQAAKIAAWWKTLRDPKLNSLIERAILANPEIGAALNRVQQAREHESSYWEPRCEFLGAGGGAGRGTGTNCNQAAPRSVDTRYRPEFAGFQEIQGVAGFDAGWELDLFGKYRRALEAARYDTQSAFEARNATLVRIVAEVARNYAVLRGLQLRVGLLKENIARAENHVKLTLSRFDQGLTNEGDVLLARRELEALIAALPSLNAAIFEAESRIALLLGVFSGDVIGELSEPRALPQTPGRLRPGQPIDLLRRRPDIRQAERDLAAATARIGVATADLFPRVGVTAGAASRAGRETAGASPPIKGTASGRSARAPIGRYWISGDWTRLSIRPNTGHASFSPTIARPW